MSQYPGVVKNALASRYAKFIVAALFAFVEIAAVWANGPEWFYVAAPVVAALLVMLVPNAPTYKDPRSGSALHVPPRT